MRGAWAGSLGLSLGLWLGTATADEPQWLPAAPQPAPRAGVSLGRPMPLNAPAPRISLGQPRADLGIQQASYGLPPADASRAVIRAQSPDPGAPPPPVPPSPAMPPVPPPSNEGFNCGVVTDPPASSGHPFLNGLNNFFGGCKNAVGGIFSGGGAAGAGRGFLESDHCFDVFSSPVSNQFLFEDPRSVTEIRPIFIHEGTPLGNRVFRGGDVDFLGLQARVALTNRLSLVLNEIGFLAVEPHNTASGYSAHVGWSELRFGPKYTFIRNEQTHTLLAGGLNFDFPIGPSKVFTDTGSLSLEPYVSFGQNFWKTNYGSLNFLANLGYSVGTDSKRSDFIYNSYHLDYDVANLHKIYPLIELNYFHYTDSGTARPLGFEGRDLINFGSTGVSGHDNLSMAVGARYKFSERLQTGFAYEFPLNGRRDLLDYRLNFDVIFRW